MTAPAPRSFDRRVLSIARAGAGAVVLYPLRSATTVACVVAMVLPFTVGSGVSGGLRAEVRDEVRTGPDLVVTGTRYGRPAPVPLEAAETLRRIAGVTDVVPRVVGELNLGVRSESAVVVGLPAERLPPGLECVVGRMFAPGAPNELVVGSDLARDLDLVPGKVIPPFYRNDAGERLSTVVGVFRADGPPWRSRQMLVSLETAWNLFAERGTVTEFLLGCPEGMREAVAESVRAIGSLDAPGAPPVRPRVVTRGDVEAMLTRQVLDRETFFTLPFLIAFALGIPIVLITSGAGLAERRREVAILKTVGWSQDALLFRALVESALLGIAGGAIATLLAFLWLSVLNGAGIAPVLFPGAARTPAFRVPWALDAVPVLLAFSLSAAIVAAGTLYSTWRTATAPPAETLR